MRDVVQGLALVVCLERWHDAEMADNELGTILDAGLLTSRPKGSPSGWLPEDWSSLPAAGAVAMIESIVTLPSTAGR